MIIKPAGVNSYIVKDGPAGLPIGDIVNDPGGWVFWPSVYRKPIKLKIAGEILNLLQELNRTKDKGHTG